MSRPNRQNKWRASSSAASPGMPAPPHLHAGGVILDDDAGALVWARLRASPATAQRASGVCKEWRQYVLATFEHELDLAGICSEKHLRYAKQPHAEVSDEALFADMTRRLAPFRSLRAIKAHDFSWLSDASLRAIAAAKEGPLSLLTSFDVSGCLGVSSLGVKALAKTGRLRSFRQDTTRRHSSCAHMRATEATIKAVAESPVLESLSLTLGSKVHKGLEVLSGHPSLRSLTLFMEGFTPLALPAKLPELTALHLKTSVWAGFDWRGQRFTHLEYPKLEEIVIEDGAGPSGNGAAVEMTMGFLHVLRTKFPACSIKLTKTGLFRGIRGAAAQQALQEPGLRQDVTEQNPLVLPQGDDWNRAFDDYEVGPESPELDLDPGDWI